MKWKAISRKLGRKGYKGILGKEVGKNINSKDPNCDIQKELKEMCERMKFDPLETIIEIEQLFVAVLEDYGYVINMPYNYRDTYNFKTGKKVGWHGTISSYVENKMDIETWDLEPEGRAAQILTNCYILKGHLKDKNITEIVRWSMSLQGEIDKFNFSQWEYPARVGEYIILERRKAAKKSATLRKGNNIERNNEIILLFIDGIPTSILAKRKGLSIKQIQTIVKPYRK